MPCAVTGEHRDRVDLLALHERRRDHPGIAVEGARAVWQLGQVTVADGGADGVASTEPNGVFAVQGVFVP